MKRIICFLSINSLIDEIIIAAFSNDLQASERYMDELLKVLNSEPGPAVWTQNPIFNNRQSSQSNVFGIDYPSISNENLEHKENEEIAVHSSQQSLLNTDNRTHMLVNHSVLMESTIPATPTKKLTDDFPAKVYLDILDIFQNDTKKLINHLRKNLKSFKYESISAQEKGIANKSDKIEDTPQPNVLLIKGLKDIKKKFKRKRINRNLSRERSHYYSDDQYYGSDDIYYYTSNEKYDQNDNYVQYLRQNDDYVQYHRQGVNPKGATTATTKATPTKATPTKAITTTSIITKTTPNMKPEDDKSTIKPNTQSLQPENNPQAANSYLPQIMPPFFYIPNCHQPYMAPQPLNPPPYMITAVVTVNIG